MKPQNFINQMNADFVRQAADLSAMSQIDETVQKMRRDPHKLAIINEMNDHLQTIIEDSFAAEMAAQKIRVNDITTKDALVQIAADVSDRVATENPNILRPIIQREVAYYVTAIVVNAVQGWRPAQPQTYDPR